jgi:hypothetical protein
MSLDWMDVERMLKEYLSTKVTGKSSGLRETLKNSTELVVKVLATSRHWALIVGAAWVLFNPALAFPTMIGQLMLTKGRRLLVVGFAVVLMRINGDDLCWWLALQYFC